MKFKLRSQFVPQVVAEEYTQDLTELSISVDLSSDNKQLLNLKGHLFVTASIKVKEPAKIYSQIKIFLEKLKDGYYQVTDETPIHTLEKELKKSIDLAYFCNEDSSNTEIFSVSTAVIWNKVLYIGYYGDGGAYLIRGNGVRSLKSSSNPNEIWTNSCLLMSDDIVIIGTKNFTTNFSVKKIVENIQNLSLMISEEQKINDFGAIIIKYEHDDLNNVKDGNTSNVQEKFEKKLDNWGTKLSNYFNFRKSLNKTKEGIVTNQVQNKTPVFSINSEILESKTNREALINKFRYKRLAVYKKEDEMNYKKILIYIALLSLLIIITWASYMLFFRDNDEQKEISSAQFNEVSQIGLSEDANGVGTQNQQLSDTSDLSFLIFVDEFINLENDFEDSYFSDIAVFNDRLVVIDENNKNLLMIDMVTKEIEVLLEDLESPELITCNDELCYLLDESSIIVMDPDDKGVYDKIAYSESADVIDINTSGVSLYLLQNSKIDKYDNTSGNITEWTNAVTNQSTSLAVDDGIYTLQNRAFDRFFKGERIENYSIDDNSNLIQAQEIKYKNDNLYVYDTVTKSISTYKPNGIFVTNTKLISRDYTKNIRSFDVSEDGELYILIGNNIHLLDTSQ